MCCAGCQAVARTIVAAGFERYYETRSGLGPPPQDLPPLEAYDDPLAQKEFVAASGENLREAALILDRIRCAACLWLSEQWLRQVPGVLRVEINYATHRAHLAWDARRVKLSEILEAIRAIGYDAYPYDPRRQDELERRERRSALWRLFVAGFGAMQVMMYAFPAYLDAGAGTLSAASEQLMRWASLALTTPVMLFSCRPFFAAAWSELRRRRIGLDTPIALGLAAGFGASAWATFAGRGEVYFDSITMLVFLLLGARFIEASARRRAARELDHLSRWMPSFALRLRDPADAASVERVPAHRLAAGERVLVPAGERVPADGVVERGDSSADESLLTGESRPVAKVAGAALVGGSVNLEQPLVMRVTRAGAETQAAAIPRLVERAASGKPRLVERADCLAPRLTLPRRPVAGGAFLWWLVLRPPRAPAQAGRLRVVQAARLPSFDQQPAGIWRVEQADHVQQRALARARRSDQRRELAAREAQIDAVQHLGLERSAGVVGLAHALQKQGLAGLSHGSPPPDRAARRAARGSPPRGCRPAAPRQPRSRTATARPR